MPAKLALLSSANGACMVCSHLLDRYYRRFPPNITVKAASLKSNISWLYIDRRLQASSSPFVL
jgi:hypothetical protein